MQILLRSTRIIDPDSAYNGKEMDILIDDGKIVRIGTGLDDYGVDEVIEGDDLHVSIGWVDMYATIGDPGQEHKEEIGTGLAAAAQGGFTKVAVSPETKPAIDDKSKVRYLLKKAEGNIVDLLPIGAMTKALQGTELAEMFDMRNSGAVAFSNGKHSIRNTKLQHLALLYAKHLDAAMYSFCEDHELASGGQMHEGTVSTGIGLKGIPALAEEIIVSRNIYLAEYADVALHLSHITTKGSVELIRAAKKRGARITASVPAHHLLFTDEHVADFDPNFKVSPPLRNAEHVTALKEALADGTIDAIISDHEPHEIEAKFSEFSLAQPGIIALETLFPVICEALADVISMDRIIAKLTTGPRNILRLECPKIAEGAEAELTVFAPNVVWTYEKKDVKSRSYNSPLLGRQLTGLPVAIINKGQLHVNS